MGKFSGKAVIVTGASGGIGAVIASAFAKEGARLAIIGRNEERLRKIAEKCKYDGSPEVLEIFAALTELESLESVVNKTVEKFGAIDVLVNNAGALAIGPISELRLDDYQRVMEVNLRAPVFLSKYALPHLIKSKGCVANISGITSMRSTPGAVIIGMTKCALEHFTRGFAAECAASGVRVNSVCPGVVQPAVVPAEKPSEEKQKILEHLVAKQPLGLVEASEVADGVLYVCSQTRMTGSSLVIDGGALLAG